LKTTETVSLESIGAGAAVERFQLALQEVLDNIIDPNTDAKKARVITLKITMKPDENREFSSAEISVGTTLAPITPVKTKIFIGRDQQGHGVACEYDPDQMQMFQPPALPAGMDNIYKLNKKEAAKTS
jgi:hypothetical protein